VRRHLPKALREHVAGESTASLNGSTDAILARVLGLERAMERRVGAERVSALMARCPLCDTALDPQLDIVERAIERALDQKATIEVLRSEARQVLAGRGHIGAILHYAIRGQPAAQPSATT